MGDAPIREDTFATPGIRGLGKWQEDGSSIFTRFLRRGGVGVLRCRHQEMPASVCGRRNQPVPSLRDRLDELWTPLVVVERTTQVGNRPGQRGLRNESALPHGVDDLVSRDDAAADGRQEDQQIHHLRFEMPDRASVADEVERRLHQPTADVDLSRRRGPNLFPAPHGLILDDSGGAGV
jgi:hypothetical protein